MKYVIKVPPLGNLDHPSDPTSYGHVNYLLSLVSFQILEII